MLQSAANPNRFLVLFLCLWNRSLPKIRQNFSVRYTPHIALLFPNPGNCVSPRMKNGTTAHHQRMNSWWNVNFLRPRTIKELSLTDWFKGKPGSHEPFAIWCAYENRFLFFLLYATFWTRSRSHIEGSWFFVPITVPFSTCFHVEWYGVMVACPFVKKVVKTMRVFGEFLDVWLTSAGWVCGSTIFGCRWSKGFLW